MKLETSMIGINITNVTIQKKDHFRSKAHEFTGIQLKCIYILKGNCGSIVQLVSLLEINEAVKLNK